MPSTLYKQMQELEQQGELKKALELGRVALAKANAESVSVVDKHNILLAMGRLCSRLHSDEALTFLGMIIAKQPLQDEELLIYCKALITRAVHFSMSDEVDKALSDYKRAEEAVALYRGREKEYLLSFINSGFSTLYAKRYDAQSLAYSIEYTLKCIEQKKNISADYRAEMVLLVSLYLETNQLMKAKTIVEEALQISSVQAKDDQIHATLLSQYAEILANIMQLKEALDYGLRSLEIAIAVESRNLPLNIFAFIFLCDALGRYADALEAGEMILELFVHYQTNTPIYARFAMLTKLIRIAIESGDITKAEYYASLQEQIEQTQHLPKGQYQFFYGNKFLLGIRKKDWHMAAASLEALESILPNDEKLPFLYFTLERIHYYIAKQETLTTEYKQYILQLLADAEKVVYDSDNNYMQIKINKKISCLYDMIGEVERAQYFKDKFYAIEQIYALSDKEQQRVAYVIERYKYLLMKFVLKQVKKTAEHQAQEKENTEKALAESKKAVKESKDNLKNIQLRLQQSLKPILHQEWSIKQIYTYFQELATKAKETEEIPPQHASVSVQCPPEIRQRLLQHASNLSPKELNFCYLVLRGWEMDAICAALDLQKNSLQKFRYRLSRKLNLPKNARLYTFLIDLESNKLGV